MIYLRKIVLLTLISVTLFSCRKDIDELKRLQDGDYTVVDWEPTFAVPIIDTRTTLGEMFVELDTLITKLEDDSLFLSIDENNLFVANYVFPYSSGTLEDYYTIDDHEELFEIDIPQDVIDGITILPVGTPLNSVVYDTTLLFNITPKYGALLELLELSGGTVRVEYSHNFNQDVGMNVVIKSVTKRGTNDEMSFSFDGLPSGTTQSQTQFLNDNNVDLSYTDPLTNVTSYNTLELYVSMDGEIINPTLTGKKFNIDFFIGDYKIDFVKGYLGEFSVDLPSENFGFDIFDQLDFPGINIKSPSIGLDINSTLGVGIDLTIDEFNVGYSDKTTESLGLDGEVIEIKGVDDRSDIPNNPANSMQLFSTPTLSDLLSSKPNSVNYTLTAAPASATSSVDLDFFLTDLSKISMDLIAEIPFEFSVTEYNRIDTVALSVSDSLDSIGEEEDSLVNYIEKAQLRLIIENQLPFDIELQGVIVDADGKEIDRVFDDGFVKVLANENVDSDGVALSPEDVVIEVELDQDKFDNFVEGSNIIIYTNSKTSNNDYVKLLSTYQLGIRAGILAKFKVPVEDLELGN